MYYSISRITTSTMPPSVLRSAQSDTSIAFSSTTSMMPSCTPTSSGIQPVALTRGAALQSLIWTLTRKQSSNAVPGIKVALQSWISRPDLGACEHRLGWSCESGFEPLLKLNPSWSRDMTIHAFLPKAFVNIFKLVSDQKVAELGGLVPMTLIGVPEYCLSENKDEERAKTCETRLGRGLGGDLSEIERSFGGLEGRPYMCSPKDLDERALQHLSTSTNPEGEHRRYRQPQPGADLYGCYRPIVWRSHFAKVQRGKAPQWYLTPNSITSHG